MFIEKFNNNGYEYLRLSENYRETGSTRSRRKIICNLGALDKLSDGQPDFLERLRDSFRNGKALIPELEPYVNKDSSQNTEPEMVELSFPVSGDHPDGCFITKQYADLIFNAYIKELGLAQLFRIIKTRSKIQYDLLGFIKVIVFGRILAPESKWATLQQNNSYYTPILEDGCNLYKVYDTLDVVHDNAIRIFRAINTALQKRKNGRDVSILFYDVTNFFFEIEQDDEDILNNDGVVIEEGLRKRGHSKENRPQPITQMGLYMDREGIPVGIKTFPGNKVDKSTMIQATTEIITPMGYERYIYCADRGLCTLANLAFLVHEEMGYLLSKSIKQSCKEDRNWILESNGYIEEKDEAGEVVFKYKHTFRDRTAELADGTSVTFREKVVVFWSRDYYKRELHMMEKFSTFLETLEKKTRSFTLSASQIKSIKRFLKDEVLDELNPENDSSSSNQDQETKGNSAGSSQEDKKEPNEATSKPKRRKLTQEEKDQRAAEKKAEAARLKELKKARTKRLEEQMKDSDTVTTLIDWDKVNRWRDFAGYYQIVTSELGMDDKEIISTYRELTQIENRFRTMKGTLKTRPIYLSDPDHIDAHNILCAVALTIIALIQNKLKTSGEVQAQEGQKWFTGMDPDRIQNALNAFEVETLPKNYLRFRSRTDDQAGKDLQTILNAYGLKLESRLYTPGELRALRGEIRVL
ncbi:MAG: transposase [Clostridia bacterium]|nr:transposase [Clostridia bacterium]